MYEDISRSWMDQENEGNTPEASSPKLLSRHTADIEMVLEYIEKEKIMPPLRVMQVSSRNGKHGPCEAVVDDLD